MPRLLYINAIFYYLFHFHTNAYILCKSYDKGINETFVHLNTCSGHPSTFIPCSKIITDIFWYGTILGVLLLVLREIVQMISTGIRYFRSKKNLVDVGLIVAVMWMLCTADSRVGTLVIILSACEFGLVIRQHPRFSTHIEMFRTVTESFLRFLAVYSFTILAFAFAFFTLFKNGDENFVGLWHSIFKTIIMLPGEFDDDMPFVLHPLFSRVIFLLFMFLIAIVLLNLLNGLAVSDIGKILSEAELVGLISRIRMVTYIDDILLGKLCTGWRPLAFLVNKIHVFPNCTTNNNKVCIMTKNESNPNLALKWYIYNEKTCTMEYEMDPSIIKQIRVIRTRKNYTSENEKIQNALCEMNNKLDYLMRVQCNSKVTAEAIPNRRIGPRKTI